MNWQSLEIHTNWQYTHISHRLIHWIMNCQSIPHTLTIHSTYWQSIPHTDNPFTLGHIDWHELTMDCHITWHESRRINMDSHKLAIFGDPHNLKSDNEFSRHDSHKYIVIDWHSMNSHWHIPWHIDWLEVWHSFIWNFFSSSFLLWNHIEWLWNPHWITMSWQCIQKRYAEFTHEHPWIDTNLQ
jgi:hypothetical protein